MRTVSNPQAEFKAAARTAEQARRQAVAVEVAQQQAAANEHARPREAIGALFDGKEIHDEGGRLVGRWRYRGGAFVPDYISA